MSDTRQRRTTTVLVVSTSRGLGGPARSLLTVLQHLPEDIHTILVAPPGDLTSVATHRGVADEVVTVPFRARARRRSRLQATWQLARLARRRRRELACIHANGQSELNMAAVASLASGLPIVMWAHTPRPAPTAALLRPLWWLLRGRVRWYAVGPAARDNLVRTTGTSAQRIELLANPIDPGEVVTEPIAHDGLVVGYLGQTFDIKGFDLLGDIIAKVRANGVAFDLAVSPPPANLPLELRPPWDALMAAGERHEVLLRGRQADVRDFYADCDIVLCPSRMESFGRIAVEAMANAIPVVASDLPAYRTLLGDGQAGLLFPVGDTAAAAAAIDRLVADPQLRHRLGEEGRRRARAYEPAPIVERLAAAYRQAGRGGSAAAQGPPAAP